MKASALNYAINRQIGLRGSMVDVYKMVWPLFETTPLKINWHHELIGERLEDVFHGRTRDIIFNVPPGTSKSTFVQIAFPVYCWLRDPTFRVVSASFDHTLMLQFARKHAMVMESELWRECFSDICTIPRAYADSFIVNSKQGWRMSTSIPGGKVTGYHADCHIYDDPVKPHEATEVGLAKAKEWIAGTAATRFRGLRRRVLIMQRLHEDDPSGYLEGQGFEVVRLPMRYERAFSYFKDPRRVEGELLWPDMKSEEEVAALEKDLGPMNTAAQLQQRPTPEGGAIFKKGWLKFWYPNDCAPPEILLYPDAPRKPVPRRFERVIQSWDCSFQDEDTSDWVVGTVWGVADGDVYLLDMLRERLDAPATARAISKMSKKWPRARLKLVEKKANGPAVVQMLRKRLTGLKAMDPDGGKIARANAAAGMFESGNVYLPDPFHCPWLTSYLHELFTFPVGKYDDQVDSTSQAINFLDRRRARGTDYEAAGKHWLR